MKKFAALLIGMLVAAVAWGGPTPRLVIVFPFENLSSSSNVGWLSEGISNLIAHRLESPSNYVLGRAERNAAFEQLGFPPNIPLTLASEYKVAETLGAQEAVIGNFKITGNTLTTRLQLLNVPELKLSHPLEATGDLVNLVGLETNLAWQLLAFYDPSVTTGREEDFARRFPPVRLDAFENYTRGMLSTDSEARIHFLEEANRLEPSDHRAAFQLGREYFERKNYSDSAEWFAKLNSSDADYSESRFLLGVDDFFLGHDAEAESLFSSLAQSLPLDAVFNDRGVLEARQGRYAQALADFERAHQGDRTDADFSFNMAVCAWYLKKYDLAERWLKEDLNVRDDDADAHSLLAAVLGQVGDQAGRQRELAWLAAHGENPQADAAADFAPLSRIKKTYNGRAFRLLSLAIQNAEETRLAKMPAAERGQAHLDRAEDFLSNGQLAEAERELTEAVSLLPKSSGAHLLLGEVYQREGKCQAAAGELDSSLNLHDSLPAHLWLARAYLGMHLPAAARDQTQAVLRLDPVNREAETLLHQINGAAPPGGKTP